MDMKYVGYGILFLLAVWFIYKTFVPVAGLKTLTSDSFAEQSKGKLIIDVREVNEYKRGHLAKSVNIPLSQLNTRLSEIPKDQPVYLYCQSGMRSKKAAGILLKNGNTEIVHLSGGISAWNGSIVK
jgi:rhodanese-related sulfurtransferase